MDNQSISNTSSALFQNTDDVFVEPQSDSNTYIIYGIILLFVVVLVAHYAGFNIFGYLGKGTDSVGNIVFPIWEKILSWWASLLEIIGGGSVAESKEIGKVTAETVKKGASIVEKELDGDESEEDSENTEDSENDEVDANISESSMSGGKKSKNGETPITKASDVEEDEYDKQIDKQIENSELNKQIKKAYHPTESDREKIDDIKPNDVFSGTPRARPGNNKSGWCYIGTYSGYRSCSRVGEADKCMSGDIFPTHDVCVNPNLRA